jgi:hypothetical protein
MGIETKPSVGPTVMPQVMQPVLVAVSIAATMRRAAVLNVRVMMILDAFRW